MQVTGAINTQTSQYLIHAWLIGNITARFVLLGAVGYAIHIITVTIAL